MAVVVTDSSCSPPCTNKRTWVREETTTGPDGRYQFPLLPPGPVIVLTSSSARQQVCGAATTLSATTHLDVEITSNSNPQPSPTMPPLTITGQIYETTPAGRVGLDGASVYMEWIAPDSPFMTFTADKNGRFSACGIPANTPIAFWTSKTGYNNPYDWHQFNNDTTVDIELTRR